MNFRSAKKVRVGDTVTAPRVGLHTWSEVTAVTEDPDPRVQLLFTVKDHKYPMNYKLIDKVTFYGT